MKAREADFLELIKQHERLIYKISFNYCRDAKDREDLVQEIIFQLWKSYPGFKPNFKVSTWMYKVALNTAVSFYRKHGKKKEQEIALEHSNVHHLENTASDAKDEQLKILEGFIQELEPVNKALIILQLEGESITSIAQIVGLSETNVATKLSRIKKSLAQKFKSQNI